jgi:hypothetical protein
MERILDGTRITTANKGFASGGLMCKLGVLCFYSSSVQVDSFMLGNPHLRQAIKRYQPLPHPNHTQKINLHTVR